MVLFKERKELEEQYKQWLKENPEVKDCPFNVITFLQSIGRLKDNKNETISTKLRCIADEYGYEVQSRQLVEEMAELTFAINKDWRKRNDCLPSDADLKKGREGIIEEIADVEVVLSQIKYLMNCEVEVMQVKKQKIDRQLLRIEANKG